SAGVFRQCAGRALARQVGAGVSAERWHLPGTAGLARRRRSESAAPGPAAAGADLYPPHETGVSPLAMPLQCKASTMSDSKPAAARLRSRQWFNDPANVDMTALYLERY